MKKPRFVIAATRSGSGKTWITCAMLKAFSMRGLKVSAMKCGPDYIDPMFHNQILEIPSKNLDLFFTGEEETRGLFLQDNRSDLSVVEGVMGLYDGMGGVSEEASTYHLAKTLQAPIVLVVNARGMGRSILAELAGFLSMDTDHLIQGVILNCITGMFYETIKPVIEKELGLKVLGYVPMQKDLQLESRYLGLKLPNEVENLKEMTRQAAQGLEKTVELDAILAIAGDAPDLEAVDWDGLMQRREMTSVNIDSSAKVRIAVAKDEAFCFYYEDNLRMLEKAGAQLVPFSPVHDVKLPENIQGILLGGGYPELYARELSENESMRADIKDALEKGIPSLAECGGFMYLHDFMETKDGETFPMVGVIHGGCHYAGKLVRFGYISIEEKCPKFLAEAQQKTLHAHEFHYYDSDENGADCISTKPITERSWEAAYVTENQWWGYAHLYYPSCPEFVWSFVKKCAEYNS